MEGAKAMQTKEFPLGDVLSVINISVIIHLKKPRSDIASERGGLRILKVFFEFYDTRITEWL